MSTSYIRPVAPFLFFRRIAWSSPSANQLPNTPTHTEFTLPFLTVTASLQTFSRSLFYHLRCACCPPRRATSLSPRSLVKPLLLWTCKTASIDPNTHEQMHTQHPTQGTLSALNWEHVSVADSLAMGDAAVRMAESGVSSVACLGVDFMAESVRATLDSRGFQGVPVREKTQEYARLMSTGCV